MAELIAFNAFRLKKKIYIYKYDKEIDFLIDGNKIEVKWNKKPEEKKDTIILCKKTYDPEKCFYPLPIYILWFLKNKEKS